MSRLRVPPPPPKNPDDPIQTCFFTWYYRLSMYCSDCGQKRVIENLRDSHQLFFLTHSIEGTVQDFIDGHFSKETRNCPEPSCEGHMHNSYETLPGGFPIVLTLGFATAEGVENSCPSHLDPEIMFLGVRYYLVATVDGNGAHFVSRYVRRGRVCFFDDNRHAKANTLLPSPEHSSSRNANINLIFPVSVEMDDGQSDPLEGHFLYSQKSSRSGSYSKYGE